MGTEIRWSERLPEFGGSLVTAEDPEYETLRRVWNGMIDRRPAVIARCRTVGDVQAALALARREKLPVAIRGGAHNVAGNATVEGGMVLDLSGMKAITVDAARRRVSAGPGLTWAELDAATHPHGLAVTGGLISTTGIAGFTLGGGIGWLMRKHGLTADNLVGAELVTADGQVLEVDTGHHPDLFWALRGGGGNFGIVTRFDYQLHPVRTVLGGLTLYPAARAGVILRYFRELTEDAPDELTLLYAANTAPPAPFVPEPLRGKPACAILACWCGDPAEGERVLKPLHAFGPPAADVLGPMPYPALQSMLDRGAPPGMQNCWKGAYLGPLTDAAIDTVVEHAGRMRSPLSQIHLHHLGGAVGRVAEDATAFAHRGATFAMNIIGMWPEPGSAAATPHTAWAREAFEAMGPHTTGGVYVNFLGDEGQDRVKAAYGPRTYARLQEVKRRHDPDNVFRLNQNIRPRD